MSSLPGCLLIVTATIDAEVEEAWNTWYDTVHLPDALACPGVLSGQRYVSAGDASVTERGAKSVDDTRVYTTVYELAGPEALETPEFKAMRGWYEFTDRIQARTQVLVKR